MAKSGENTRKKEEKRVQCLGPFSLFSLHMIQLRGSKGDLLKEADREKARTREGGVERKEKKRRTKNSLGDFPFAPFGRGWRPLPRGPQGPSDPCRRPLLLFLESAERRR